MTRSIVAVRGCTSFKVRQLARSVGRRYDLALADAGLKTTQYSLLSHLVALGPIAPGRLAAAMAMDASTLTRNVRPLVAAGWAEMGAGGDARTRSLAITPAGRAKRAEARERWRSAQRGLEAALGAERVAALHGLIDDCLGRLGEAEAPP